MLDGFTIQLSNGKYFKTSKSSTDDITKAKIYQSLGTLLKYAVQPNYVHNNMIDGDIQLIQLKETDDSISVVELGPVWSCYHVYSMGYNISRSTILSKDKILKAMQCLADNGVPKEECSTITEALCSILVDLEIEDVCRLSQKEWDGKTLH